MTANENDTCALKIRKIVYLYRFGYAWLSPEIGNENMSLFFFKQQN